MPYIYTHIGMIPNILLYNQYIYYYNLPNIQIHIQIHIRHSNYPYNHFDNFPYNLWNKNQSNSLYNQRNKSQNNFLYMKYNLLSNH